jgi:hypothetical protein
MISVQPEDETVMEFFEASFNILATNTEEYKWMVSTNGGNSWTDLSDIPPYFDVNTHTLTINPASYDMNQYQYACQLNSELCIITSESAILTVDTLTFINSMMQDDGIKIYPVPCRDNLKINNNSFGQIHSFGIYSLKGTNYKTYTLYINTAGEIDLDLSFLPQGFYILRFIGSKDGNQVFGYNKIFKIE